MDHIEVHIKFIEHIADCLMLQKVINIADESGKFKPQQEMIDQTLKQLREISGDYHKKVKRSMAQNSKQMYYEHHERTVDQLSLYTGPTTEKGNY